MPTTIKFGTDGWRALIAEDYTFANVRLCAQGVANYLRARGTAPNGLVIGYDTRFNSEHFAAAVAEVLAGNGIKAYLCVEPMPTPGISFNILEQKAAGAAIITASHNSGLWNGFKYKPEYAGSASPEVIGAIEAEITKIEGSPDAVKRLALAEGRRQGLVQDLDGRPAYLDQLRKLVDVNALKGAGFTIVADAMFGAGRGYFEELLGGGSTKIVGIHQDRNPLFPGFDRPEPIAENLGPLMAAVPANNAHAGLATDGDADRIGVVDEKGGFVNQLITFGLLALYLLRERGWRGPLVKSLSTSSMIDRLGEKYGVPVHETAVGFKYIGPKMLETDAIIGGEESGGFGFKGHIPERDGVLAGLFILDFMVRQNRPLSGLVADLFSEVGAHYYRRIDYTFDQARRGEMIERVRANTPSEIAGDRVATTRTEDGFKFTTLDGSWLLIRFSGTEPVLRVYTETPKESKVEPILAAGRELVGL
ncbi:MAG: phosphoglucomutase/phosphomannomutase family protein [Chloroflexi bacterium]|nr:phosphoglucomutase/phosphomannomutase family protein [Chloroflexota bacterium]